jgi:hypothetical protein
MQQGIT